MQITEYLRSYPANYHTEVKLKRLFGDTSVLDELVLNGTVEKRKGINGYVYRVNYPRTKDSWASDFTEEFLFKRLGLLSSPSV